MAFELRFGGYSPPGTVFSRALEQFKALVERESAGRVQVALFPNVLALGFASGQIVKLVEHGLLGGCYMSTATPELSRLSPHAALFDLPFLISSRRQAFEVADGRLGRLIADEIEAGSNLKHIGYWENGFRHITNGRRPVRTPDDLAGLRLRIQTNPWHERAFRLLGAEPVAMDVSELMAALREGRVDGQENPHENTLSLGFLPHTKYVTLTGHLYGLRGMYLNRGWFERLPHDLRELVLAAGRTVSAEQRVAAEARDEELLGQLEAAGAEVVELAAGELAEFRVGVRPVYEEMAARLGREVIEEVVAG